jgi:subtilase family serine protease
VAIPSSGPYNSTYFSFEVTVKNIGAYPASYFKVWCIEENNSATGWSLDPGESQSVTIPPLDYHLSPGEKTVKVTIEYGNRDCDENKTNNSFWVTFVVTE